MDRGAWTAKTVKRPRQQPAHPQYAADAQIQHSPKPPTTGTPPAFMEHPPPAPSQHDCGHPIVHCALCPGLAGAVYSSGIGINVSNAYADVGCVAGRRAGRQSGPESAPPQQPSPPPRPWPRTRTGTKPQKGNTPPQRPPSTHGSVCGGGGGGSLLLNTARQATDGLWTEARGQQKQAPLTRKRHPPHPAQPQHTNHWAPRTRKRHQQEHRPQWPTERSDLTQHAKGRTGDCPGPRKETTTRRNVTQGGYPPPPGPPFPPLLLFQCLRLTAKILLRCLRCQED